MYYYSINSIFSSFYHHPMGRIIDVVEVKYDGDAYCNCTMLNFRLSKIDVGMFESKVALFGFLIRMVFCQI